MNCETELTDCFIFLKPWIRGRRNWNIFWPQTVMETILWWLSSYSNQQLGTKPSPYYALLSKYYVMYSRIYILCLYILYTYTYMNEWERRRGCDPCQTHVTHSSRRKVIVNTLCDTFTQDSERDWLMHSSWKMYLIK